MKIIEIVDIVASLTALLALVISVRQEHVLRGQAKDLRSQARLSRSHKKMLDSINDALTTRHIGQFPDYMKTIVDLVGKSNKNVTILCDFPAYGCFSAPSDFLAYRQTLERKIEEGKLVRITSLDSPSRGALSREQFSLEEKDLGKWEEWKTKNQERLTIFLNSHGGTTVGDLTLKHFTYLLEEEDQRMLKRPFKKENSTATKEYIPVYFWIIDESEAVFSIPSFTERATEHGFHTSDHRLILGLKDLEARYRSRNSMAQMTS